MPNAIPGGRMQLSEQAPKQIAAMYRLETSIRLDGGLRDLVRLRASQINGCAFCIDMHWKDSGRPARARSGYSLDGWRESPLYSDRERTALELCEAMTLIADGHVPDQVWGRAREGFGAEELGQLVFAITAINAWNRLMITARVEPGHYEPALRKAA
jgi:AhpD family alkylhydroperoxidase